MLDEVHPITIRVLLLLSSNIHGMLGIIVAIPTHFILKEIAKFLVDRYDNHKETQQKKKEELGIDWFQSLDTRNKTEEGFSVLDWRQTFQMVFVFFYLSG